MLLGQRENNSEATGLRGLPFVATDPETGARLSAANIRNQALTFLIAGHGHHRRVTRPTRVVLQIRRTPKPARLFAMNAAHAHSARFSFGAAEVSRGSSDTTGGSAADRVHHRRGRAPLMLGLLAGMQTVVVVASVALRLITPGWLLVMLIFGGFLVVVAPIVIGTVFGGYALSMGGRRLRSAATAALGVTDLSLLVFASTVPDITDSESDTAAPILVLTSGRREFSGWAIDICTEIAGIGAVVHLASVAVVIGLGIAAMCRGSQGSPAC